MLKYLLKFLPLKIFKGKKTFVWYRKTFWKEHYGKNVDIFHPVVFFTAKKGLLSFGDNSCVSEFSNIRAVDQPIKIGNCVRIAQLVSIISDSHKIESRDIKIMDQGTYGGPIIIEDDVWIGCNSVILPNVTIGKGAVVSAGSVVRNDIPPYAIVAGNPARIVGYRK